MQLCRMVGYFLPHSSRNKIQIFISPIICLCICNGIDYKQEKKNEELMEEKNVN